MTERLYYHDSFLHEFDANVVEAVERGGRAAVVLDQTAFYPTSGGQIFDTGVISAGGGEARVIEVAEDEQDESRILHFIEGAAPQGLVRGKIDGGRRFDHMQQHTGQHVLSAAFVKVCDAQTVSFHMGDESCTIDLAVNKLAAEQIVAAEKLANQVVLEDRPVEMFWATAEEARNMGVRKIPEGKPRLRLIHVREFDLNACGGTHVTATGQIGAILVRGTEKVKQGVRVEFVCGMRAVRTARRDFEALTSAAGALSAHIWELPEQIRKLLDESKAAAKQQHRMLEEVAALYAEKLLAEQQTPGAFKVIARAFPDRDVAFVRMLGQKITAAGPAVALLAAGAGQPTLVFMQSRGLSSGLNMQALLQEALAELGGGSGGGNQAMAQAGVAPEARAKLDECLQRMKERAGK